MIWVHYLSMGPVRGWIMIHIYVNQNLTRVPSSRREDVKIIQKQKKAVNERSEKRRQTGPPTEDLEERRHLENTLSNYLHRKVKLQGRQQSRASNEMRKYLGRWLPPPHLMPCTNWTSCIYEEKISDQWFHSLQPSLPPLIVKVSIVIFDGF